MARICAVIVHGHGRHLLGSCLRELLSSSAVDIEVVVVANACDDGMPDIAVTDLRVFIVESDSTLGFSEANNLGVDWATNHLSAPDFFLFLNDDAFVEPDALGKLTEIMDRKPEAAIVGPRLMIWGGQDHLNSLGINVTVVGEAWDEGIGVRLEDYGPLPPTRPVLAVTGAALMIRAKLLADLGGWESLYDYYYEDIDLCLRARALGYEVLNRPDAIVWHAISASAGNVADFKRYLMWRNRLLLPVIHWPISLLMSSGPRMVLGEIKQLVWRLVHRAFADARLQLRGWLGALWQIGPALRARNTGPHTGWAQLLRPAGSIPEIRLPEVAAESVASVSASKG